MPKNLLKKLNMAYIKAGIKKYWTIALDKIIDFFRSCYYAFLKCRLKNINPPPSIIASDCFGGFMYHNLGLQFRSPTVNLLIEKSNFIEFVTHLKEYLAAELTEITDNSVEYPVGLLKHGDNSVRIDFMHYKTFEQAKQKWEERKKRVSFDNICIVQLIADVTEDDIKAFDKLPFESKMLVANKNPIGSKNVVVHPVFSDKNYKHGQILLYKHRFSIKKYMDSIDYVSFLNSIKHK